MRLRPSVISTPSPSLVMTYSYHRFVDLTTGRHGRTSTPEALTLQRPLPADALWIATRPMVFANLVRHATCDERAQREVTALASVAQAREPRSRGCHVVL
jgi:hypothetical protein